MPAVQQLKVNLNDEIGMVPRAAYAKAKHKQLVEFGYTTLTLSHVEEQIDAVLASKTLDSGLTVIGGFMEGEIIVE